MRVRPVFALTVAILAALPSVGASLPDDAARWLPGATPLLIRRIDVDLDQDDDRVAVVQYPDGHVEAVTLCYHPVRWWRPWGKCGSLDVGGRGVQGGKAQVKRLDTGDFDGDGRVDLLVDVGTADGLHHLALGPLLKPQALMVAPELHLKAQAFSLWDIGGNDQVVVVAWRPEGAAEGLSHVTFVREVTGWRRSHGVNLAPRGDGLHVRPVTRVPDVRGESLPGAVAMLNRAGLRPGMIATVDQGKGFRGVTAQHPAPGGWIRGGRPIDLAVGVPSYPARIIDTGDVSKVVVHGPGGKRMEVKETELKDWSDDLNSILATASRRVRVMGPPLKGPTALPLAPGETRVEISFRRPLRVELPEGLVEASSILLPFVEYERGLLFLGSPDYQEALTYLNLEQNMERRAHLLTDNPST